jgi:hypothetical protein
MLYFTHLFPHHPKAYVAWSLNQFGFFFFFFWGGGGGGGGGCGGVGIRTNLCTPNTIEDHVI